MMNKYYLLILMLISGQLIASEFEEAFDLNARGFEKQANKVTLYFNTAIEHDLNYQQQELELIISSMQGMEKSFENNPVFWFVKGLHAKNMASYFKKKGQEEKVSDWLNKKTKHYKKAMRLDKVNGPHLSAASYATMKSGLLSEDKQDAIEMELALGGNGENESYYWYLHWSNINELQKQGKIEEADKALEKMKNELADSGQSKVFDGMMDKIEKELDNKKQETSKQKVLQKKSAVRKHTAFTEEDSDEQYYRYLIYVVMFMVVLALLGLVFELKRRKK